MSMLTWDEVKDKLERLELIETLTHALIAKKAIYPEGANTMSRG
jgi:hypothetical protein